MGDKIYASKGGRLIEVAEIPFPPEDPPAAAAPKEPPIWFLVTMGIIVIAVLAGGLALLVIAVADARTGYSEFARRDAIIQECLDSERYTHDECVIIGGSK